jgi:hypothetical protein
MAHQPLTRVHKLGIEKRVTNFQTRIAKIVDDGIHLGDRERRMIEFLTVEFSVEK